MAKMLMRLTLQPHHYLGCTYTTNGPIQHKWALQWRENNPHCLVRPYSKTVTSCYDTLQVTPSSTQSQIKAAYYRLSKKYHPDVNKTEKAQQKFAEISEAYEILGNKKNRMEYDQSLRRSPPTEGRPRDVHDAGYYPRTFRQRTGPVYGRSQAYDYDEFYRKHYGDRLKETMESRQAFEAYKKDREQREKDNLNRSVFALSVVFSVLGYAIGKIITRFPK